MISSPSSARKLLHAITIEFGWWDMLIYPTVLCLGRWYKYHFIEKFSLSEPIYQVIYIFILAVLFIRSAYSSFAYFPYLGKKSMYWAVLEPLLIFLVFEFLVSLGDMTQMFNYQEGITLMLRLTNFVNALYAPRFYTDLLLLALLIFTTYKKPTG